MNKNKLFVFECDDPRFKRKNKPEVWKTIDKIEGKMFCVYPSFSFIPGTRGSEEPVRYGDFIIDIDTKEIACQDAIKIIDWFDKIYCINQASWKIYLSGKKGIHLELPAEILGTKNGHIWLTLGYKRLALEIEASCLVNLDISMYNRGTGKPYRQPNIMRKIGTCKRQITYNDLFEITTKDEYIKRCSEPGKLWLPEEIVLCKSLSTIMEGFLQEAEESQKILKNKKPLSEQTLEHLIQPPPCIKKLSCITTQLKSGATFNDIGIQLASYGATLGVPENTFLAACKVMLENYPSNSLDTIEKRYDNFSARYRTAIANGYEHSCGGILALRAGGFDCSECKIKTKKKDVSTIEVITNADVSSSDMTLHIPHKILYPGGLFNKGMAGFMAQGLPTIEQYSFPVVCAAIARAISGKITCQDVWPNIYCVKVGPTSSGKTESDKELYKYTKTLNLIGLTDTASGPGLYRKIASNPKTLFIMDEATGLFRKFGKHDPIAEGKRDAMMDIFSRSGMRIIKSYGNSKNDIVVDEPCLTFIGNTTSLIFEEITIEDFRSGLIPRFDFYCFDGCVPYRGIKKHNNNKKLKSFSDGLKHLIEAKKPEANLAHITGAVDIGLTAECAEILSQHSISIIDTLNNTSEDLSGIISRSYHGAIKYALIHHAAISGEFLYKDLDTDSLQWGIDVVDILSNWKINVLADKIVSGDFHRDCKIFEEAVKAATKSKQRPTFSVLSAFRKQLKNWRPTYSAEIISVLSKNDLVLDESKRKTAYYWRKKI